MRLTRKVNDEQLKDAKELGEPFVREYEENDYCELEGTYDRDRLNKLGQLEDIENKLGINLIKFLKGIDPNTCFMEITRDKKFYLCGDAYFGYYSKEELLNLIQKLLFMYWALTKEELK